jgi:hypothetical protein
VQQLFCLHRLRGLHLPGVPIRNCGGSDKTNEEKLDTHPLLKNGIYFNKKKRRNVATISSLIN